MFCHNHFEPEGYGLMFRKEHFASMCRISYRLCILQTQATK